MPQPSTIQPHHQTEEKKGPPKPKMGRPTLYTPELAAEICERLAKGASLVQIAEMDGMPDDATIYRWLEARLDFREAYARARERQADFYAAEIVTISDDGSRDYIVEDGRVVVDHEHVQRSRLRVDARKWYAAKLAPKKYGDRLEVAGDKDAPLGVKFVIEGLAPKLLEKKDE